MTDAKTDVGALVEWCEHQYAMFLPGDDKYAYKFEDVRDALLAQQAEIARLTQENEALAAAMPSEGADAAIGYASMKADRDRLRERLTNEEETCRQLGRKFREEESERKSAEQRAEQAEREREDARKDAERYRWLRDCSAEHSDPPSSATLQAGLGIKVIFQSQGVCERSKLSVSLHGIALDAAIDAAREGK